MNAETVTRILKKLDANERKTLLEELKTQNILNIEEEIVKSLEKSAKIVNQQNVIYTKNFLDWVNLWNEYGIYGQFKDDDPRNEIKKWYLKGDIVWVNFGQHNIGKEFSYLHPAIVLKDYKDLLVVIPVTTDKNQKFSDSIEKIIIRVENMPQFSNGSIILIHQICTISKHRVDGFSEKTIKQTDLMKSIEEKLYENFSDFVFKTNNTEVSKLKKEIEIKDKHIEELKGILEKKQSIASTGEKIVEK